MLGGYEGPLTSPPVDAGHVVVRIPRLDGPGGHFGCPPAERALAVAEGDHVDRAHVARQVGQVGHTCIMSPANAILVLMLTETDHAILDLAAARMGRGAMERAIWDRFGWPATRYYQRLNQLIHTDAAIRHDPALCRRLQAIADPPRTVSNRDAV